MKVVAINGSAKKEGNTYHALRMVGAQLEENGIDFEIIHIGGSATFGILNLQLTQTFLPVVILSFLLFCK